MEWDDLTARRLSTRELRIFLAVVHSRSMAKAAKTVGTSQPAISKAIADMELLRAESMARVRQVLTSEQRAKLDQMREHRR